MNIFTKIYARVFQCMFVVARKFLHFRVPKTYNSFMDAPTIFKNENKKHPLIVSDKNIASLGLLDGLKQILKDNNIEFSEFYDVEPNPLFKEIYAGADIFKNDNCDSLIAVGGGSSMDAAKAIGALIVSKKHDLEKLKGLFKVHHSLPLLIACPTTCGTGSEATIAAVVRNEKTLEKFSINDLHLIPHYAIFEAKLIEHLPNKILSTTAMDAMTHAVESYIGKASTKETRKEAFEAAKLIHDNVLIAYNQSDNFNAKNNLLRASYLAGMAFTRAYVGYVHAIAHALGALYNLPHGYLCAILLPIFLDEDFDKIYKRLDKLAKYINLEGLTDDKKANARVFINYIKGLNKTFSLPSKIKEIKEEDIPVIAEKAYKESTPLYPVPVLFSKKELISIIKNKIKE